MREGINFFATTFVHADGKVQLEGLMAISKVKKNDIDTVVFFISPENREGRIF